MIVIFIGVWAQLVFILQVDFYGIQENYTFAENKCIQWLFKVLDCNKLKSSRLLIFFYFFSTVEYKNSGILLKCCYNERAKNNVLHKHKKLTPLLKMYSGTFIIFYYSLQFTIQKQ